MKVLFINSCVRGREISRSYKIAEKFIEAIKKADNQSQIKELDLMEVNPPYMSYSNFQTRDELTNKGELDDAIFSLAKEFADADRIVVAAPFWEYSFPAILKAYIENVSIAGIAFKYTEDGSVGLCKAQKMMFITTRGGFATGEYSWMECGASYLKSMCRMFGIKEFSSVAAEGIDIDGMDVEKIMKNAFDEAINMAKQFMEE